MKKAVIYLAAGASLVLAGVVLYRCALSEEARENVRRTASSVREACRKMESLVSSTSEDVMSPEDLPNRRATAAQWDALGY